MPSGIPISYEEKKEIIELFFNRNNTPDEIWMNVFSESPGKVKLDYFRRICKKLHLKKSNSSFTEIHS
jgi:hypothetical protein